MDEHQVDRLAAASVVGGDGVAQRDVEMVWRQRAAKANRPASRFSPS
ncbi:hypothetical protein ACN6LA_003584 [Streptomyces sp. SAS_269]